MKVMQLQLFYTLAILTHCSFNIHSIPLTVHPNIVIQEPAPAMISLSK